LLPVEEVDVVVPVKPERCHHCQHLLWGDEPQPQRHQVTEIPPVQPIVTEYQLHRLVCPACGEETRALVTDRWSAYTWYPTWRRQVCWAHVLRDIDAMSERGGGSREIGEALRVQGRQMFQWWHRVQKGTLTHKTFASYLWPVRQAVERLLEAGQTCGVPKTEGTCRELCKLRQALWTFVRHEGVEPTNNAAERAIRPGVLWRKGSFGTQSVEGSRVVEAMMTVVATLKQHHRNVLNYVTAACDAALCGEPAPSLLPPLLTSNRANVPPRRSVPQVNAYPAARTRRHIQPRIGPGPAVQPCGSWTPVFL
jgi:hypothetical protein